MRIAVAQMNTRAGDFEATYEAMMAYGRRAAELKVDLLIYPSVALMGADPMALIDNQAYVGQAMQVLERLAKELKVTAVVPLMMGTAGAILPTYALLKEGSIFTAGIPDHMGPFMLDDADIGLAYSLEDLEGYAEGVFDANIICYLPILGFDASDEATALASAVSDGYFEHEVYSSEAWLVAVSACGAYEDYVYAGGSFVMAPDGELAAAAPVFTEDLLVCDIDVEYEQTIKQPIEPPTYDRCRMLWDSAALALRDQVTKRNLSGVILTLDGGLATSAAAALTTDAVGPMRVSAVICASNKLLEKQARTLAKTLHIHEVDELDYQNFLRLADTVAPDADANAVVDSLINVRLGAAAQEANLLVLSAADKTELAVGEHATIDAVSSFAPFGDIFRSDVIKIARWRNTISPVFTDDVLSYVTYPAGLGLEDMPATTEFALNTLDAVLLYYFERGAGVKELAGLGTSEEFITHVFERLHATRAYRRFAPSFPVLSSRSLDELAAPVTDAWIDDGERSAIKPTKSAFPSAMNEAIKQIAGSIGPQAALPSAEEIQRHLGEMIDLLQDLSDAKRMQKGLSQDSDDNDEGSWSSNLFSEN